MPELQACEVTYGGHKHASCMCLSLGHILSPSLLLSCVARQAIVPALAQSGTVKQSGGGCVGPVPVSKQKYQDGSFGSASAEGCESSVPHGL